MRVLFCCVLFVVFWLVGCVFFLFVVVFVCLLLFGFLVAMSGEVGRNGRFVYFDTEDHP